MKTNNYKFCLSIIIIEQNNKSEDTNCIIYHKQDDTSDYKQNTLEIFLTSGSKGEIKSIFLN